MAEQLIPPASKVEASTYYKIWNVLTSGEQRSAKILLSLMCVGMVLETLSVGLVVPTVALLTETDIVGAYPWLRPAIDALGNPDRYSLAIGGMLVLVGIFCVKSLFLAVVAWRQMQFTFDVQAQLSLRLFTLYLHQPYSFHLQRNSAELFRNAVKEVHEYVYSAVMPALTLITESLVLMGLVCLLLVMEPVGTVVVGTLLGLASGGFHFYTRRRIEHWGASRLYHDGLRFQRLQEGLDGAKEIKLLGREKEFLDQYRLHCVQSARSTQSLFTLAQYPRLFLEFLAVSGLAILVISMIARGYVLNAVLPTVSLFAAAAFRLIPLVHRMLGAVQSLRYVKHSLNIVSQELKLAISKEPASHRSAMPFYAALELKQITYTYPDAKEPALKDISLTVRHSESVGFIGVSGSGKSTLVDILLGLLMPDRGEVSVDGHDIQKNLRAWQDQIGYVSQSIFLTDDTLRRNVAFGVPDAQINDATVERALRIAQLDTFVDSLPDGLKTLVGERGVRLSGGQRQRIGIARAIYHDPAVLVLDEATSALDTETEQGFMQAITALKGAKTIIVVAHRLSTVKHCDRVFRLQDGRVVAEGCSDILLATDAVTSNVPTP